MWRAAIMLRLAMAYAYSSEPWHDLFVGVSGAAAVLTGLLFVALVISILGLVPGQSATALAVELLCVGGAAWLFATAVFTVRRPAIHQRQPIVVNAVAAQLATLPVMVAGASLLAGSGGGLYWLVPALILLLSVGVIYAWVLLIEILR
jgi:hypothetical protein